MDLRTLKADLLLLLTAAIWGCAFVAQRVGMEHVGPMTFNGIRFALGSAALVPLFLRTTRGQPESLPSFPRPTWATYARSGLLAGAALWVAASLQQVGIIWTTAGNAGFITGLYVVIVPLMGLAFRQRPGWGTWTGAVAATAGLYLLSVTSDFSVNQGDALVFLSAFFWAVHLLLIGWMSPRMDPVKLSSAQFAVCSILSLATAVATEEIALSGILDAAVPILYGGLGSVGIAYTLQVVAQRDAPAAHAAIILCLEGAFAALAGWLLLGEIIGLRGLAGCGLMLAGMILSQLRP